MWYAEPPPAGVDRTKCGEFASKGTTLERLKLFSEGVETITRNLLLQTTVVRGAVKIVVEDVLLVRMVYVATLSRSRAPPWSPEIYLF